MVAQTVESRLASFLKAEISIQRAGWRGQRSSSCSLND